jgi:hypothetical protein
MRWGCSEGRGGEELCTGMGSGSGIGIDIGLGLG